MRINAIPECAGALPILGEHESSRDADRETLLGSVLCKFRDGCRAASKGCAENHSDVKKKYQYRCQQGRASAEFVVSRDMEERFLHLQAAREYPNGMLEERWRIAQFTLPWKGGECT